MRVGSIFTSVDTESSLVAETSVLCRHWSVTRMSSLLSDSIRTGRQNGVFFLIFRSADIQNNEDIFLACVPDVLAYILV